MKKVLLVLSAYHGDIDKAVDLTKWMIELGCKFDSPALFVTTKRCSSLPAAAQVIQNLQCVFGGGVTHYPLVAEDERGPWHSNNFMFRSVAQYVEHRMHDVEGFYFFEPDCTPMSADWWSAISKEYLECGMPFMGDVRGITHGLNSPLHMNGSGVYPQNVAKHSIAAMRATNSPWDSYAREEIVPKAYPTKLIDTFFDTVNYIENEEGKILVRLPKDGKRDAGNHVPISPIAKVVHGCKDGSLLAILRERRSGKRVRFDPPPPTRNSINEVAKADAPATLVKTAQKKRALAATDLSPEEVIGVRQLITTLECFCQGKIRTARVKALVEESKFFKS